MKKIILLSLISIIVKSQTVPSYVTRNKDTLYLINDTLGKQVAKAWEGEYYKPERDGKKPVIIFVDVAYIKNRYNKKFKQSTAIKK